MQVPFVGGTNRARSVSVSTQRTINLIPELNQEGTYPVALYPRPGLVTSDSAGSSPVRGQEVFGGARYAIIGDTLWKFGTTTTSIGLIGTASGTVSMAAGRDYLMIVDGISGYYTDGSTLTQITDTDFPTARQVVWLDGYFIVDDADNAGRVYRSDGNDPSSWGALNFATAERNPDGITSLAVKQRELWIIGANTTEVWYNDGSDAFGFAPVSGAYTEVGAAARFATKAAAGVIFWLGQAEIGRGAVFMADGLQGQLISNPAIQEDINAATGDLTQATADIIYFRDHVIYLLHLPGGKTLAYDQQTGQWHEWKSYGRTDFRGRHAVSLNGITYMGDAEGGNIFQLSATAYTDIGTVVERERWDRFIASSPDYRNLSHRAFEIEFEAGTGTASLNPQAMLSWSDDRGHTWSSERWRGIGKVGDYEDRALWLNLGSARSRVYRVKMTDDAKTVIVGGYLDVG